MLRMEDNKPAAANDEKANPVAKKHAHADTAFAEKADAPELPPWLEDTGQWSLNDSHFE